MSEEEIAKLKEEHEGKGPVRGSFYVGDVEVKSTLGFQIHDKDGNLIVDRTIKKED